MKMGLVGFYKSICANICIIKDKAFIITDEFSYAISARTAINAMRLKLDNALIFKNILSIKKW